MPEAKTRPSNIWYVSHPTDQYVEDVKALARAAGLKIIDAEVVPKAERKFAHPSPPTLTLKAAPAAKLSAKEQKAADEAAAKQKAAEEQAAALMAGGANAAK